MNKIATLFDRDWDGHHGVVPRFSAEAAEVLASSTDALYATEKLDGTNVRVTVRHGQPMRLEKRRNPSKAQKAEGITEPWYVEASRDDPADRFIFEAMDGRGFLACPDGEWPGEAIGPKIQGNPLDLPEHRLILFTRVEEAPQIDAPRIWRLTPDEAFSQLRDHIAAQRSALNPERPIEGIVWHNAYGGHLKLKAKDFR